MPENRMEGELDVGCEPVQLEPFVHQVGGHSGMFCFDESTVCKPLIPREQKFYEMMPKCMQRFTPEYRGTVEVSFQEDSEGYLTLMAHPVCSLSKDVPPRHSPLDSSVNSGGEEGRSDSDSESSGTRASGISKQRFRIQRSGSIEIEGITTDYEGSERLDKEQQILSRGHKPWSLKCHKQQITRMHQSLQRDHNSHKFILLENLASQFEFPCILDLKMGQRQHGDNASEQKRLHQTRKCENTTSSSLGTRISGMQVYQSDTGDFLCHSKYYGRQLDEKGVGDALRQFLHNGQKLRLDLLDPLIEILTQLYTLLKQQNTFRFYSSSLLIMYDGDEDNAQEDNIYPKDNPYPHHSVCEIRDGELHSHCTCNREDISCGSRESSDVSTTEQQCQSSTTSRSNECCTLSSSFDASVFCSSSLSCSHRRSVECSYMSADCRHNTARCSSVQNSLSFEQLHNTDSASSDNKTMSSSTTSTQRKQHGQQYFHKSRRKREVDVRMIDFAHSTYQGFRNDKTKHEGPDHGYLFGIKNLIKLFRELKHQSLQDDL